jgi:UDP-N-acetylmuramate dehydrogenase
MLLLCEYIRAKLRAQHKCSGQNLFYYWWEFLSMTIEQNASLRTLNTFGIDATAKLLVAVHNEEEIAGILTDSKYKNETRLLLGGGSNILLTQNVDGLVILNRLEGIEILHRNGKDVYLRAKAGVVWHKFVLFAIENNLGGIENLSLIPGCVGAAPIQNIGAYGTELKDVFHELEALDLHTGEKKIFNGAECEFGYRLSVFKNKYKNRYAIISVTLRLSSEHSLNTSYGAIDQELHKMGITSPTIRDVSNAVIHIRSAKLPDPAKIGNAGSFFKNPELPKEQYAELKNHFPEMVAYPAKEKMKLAAGWLIEQCGWKGLVSGHVGMHKQQALVLVNYGGATGEELYRHAQRVQQSVQEKFGVELEMEVNVV